MDARRCEQSQEPSVSPSPNFHSSSLKRVTSIHIVRARHFIARRARAKLHAKLGKKVRTTHASRERAHRSRQRPGGSGKFRVRGAWRGLPKIAPPLETRRGEDDGERRDFEDGDETNVDDLRAQKVGRWVSSRWLERQGFVASRPL
jgi:hypothetical protein